MITIAKSMAESDRLARLVREFKTGELHRRARKKDRVHGCFFTRLLNPDGSVARDWDAVLNGATYQGLNYQLEAAHRGGTQVTTWYIALINGSGFSQVSVNDTAASHGGWTEYTAYNETARQTWTPGAAANGVIVNSTPNTITNGGSLGSVQGLALFSVSTKSATSGTLFSTAVKNTPDSIAAGQTYQFYYEIDLSPLN